MVDRASHSMLGHSSRGFQTASIAGLCFSALECRWTGKMSIRSPFKVEEWRTVHRSQGGKGLVVVAAAVVTHQGGAPGWDFGEDLRQRLQNGSGTGKTKASRVGAKWNWWKRKNETALGKEDALPLPMTYPDCQPLPKEAVEKLEICDPEKEDCKNVVYQWTGKCKRCQGTGTVSFYRKKGREVISNCIMCLGIGYVHKFTERKDVEQEDLS